jgi:replication factor C subunit 2/4
MATLPWTELYRPKKMDDIILQPAEKKFFNAILEHAQDGNMVGKPPPNIIICGPPGCGKTTSLICMAKALLGEEHYEKGCKELNSSDDRGLPALDGLRSFCNKSTKFLMKNGSYGKYFKVIVFDEGDKLTEKAQMEISQLMSAYPDVSFTFTCNESQLLKEDIQSKCTILRFLPMARKLMEDRLKDICKKHGAAYTDAGISEIVLSCDGDLRLAINIAQSVWSGYRNITPENIQKIHRRPAQEFVLRLLGFCQEGKLKKALDITSEMLEFGSSIQDILESMQSILIVNNTIDPKFRMHCMTEVGKTMYALHSFQTILQLEGCLARLAEPALLTADSVGQKEKKKKAKSTKSSTSVQSKATDSEDGED